MLDLKSVTTEINLMVKVVIQPVQETYLDGIVEEEMKILQGLVMNNVEMVS